MHSLTLALNETNGLSSLQTSNLGSAAHRARAGGKWSEKLGVRQLEDLDVDGLFWLDGKPDDKVAGRLKFNMVNGADLILIGAFHDLRDVFFPRDKPVRILGVAGKRLLTLERCIHAGSSLEVPGMISERYTPEFILSGAHFVGDMPLEFCAVYLELRHLEHWIWKCGTRIDYKRDDPGGRISEIQVNYSPPPKAVIPMDIGELELEYMYSFHRDPMETTIAQRCSIGVKFGEPYALEDAIKVGSSLQNLLTVGVHSPTSFNKVTLSHPDLLRTLPGGREVPELISMYAQFRGSNTPRQDKAIHPTRMLFTFDDIGGLDGIAKWLVTSDKFRLVIDSLLSHWYLPAIYTDNRLLNIIIAAEAFERVRLQTRKINFKDALKSLIKLAGAPFRVIVDNVDTWSNEIVRARVNNLVHRGMSGDLEGQRMYVLSESLYFLVVLCLLRECGISEETLSKMQEHESFRWIEEQLRALDPHQAYRVEPC